MKIILASKSKRRHFLLKQLIKEFAIINSNFDESSIKKKCGPKKYCKQLAYLKADLISKENPSAIVIAADTIVSIDNQILEKPSNYDDAFNMLRKLSGKMHSVYTGVSIISQATSIDISFVETTKVKFSPLRDQDIKQYILESKPYDKSGSYGIQDDNFIFVDYIIGNYENIIGLPTSKLYKLLLELKIIK